MSRNRLYLSRCCSKPHRYKSTWHIVSRHLPRLTAEDLVFDQRRSPRNLGRPSHFNYHVHNIAAKMSDDDWLFYIMHTYLFQPFGTDVNLTDITKILEKPKKTDNSKKK